MPPPRGGGITRAHKIRTRRRCLCCCFVEWKQSDVVTLLDQIQTVMPNDDNVKYSTMADKLEWDRVKVGHHTAADCKDQWINITTKVL